MKLLLSQEYLKNIKNEFLKRTKPICKICIKEVDYFEVYNNFCHNTLVFVAECHGDKDHMEIENNIYIDWSLYEKGFAFDKKFIEKNYIKELEFEK